MHLRRAFIQLCLACIAPVAMQAQVVDGSLEIGGARVRQGGLLRGDALMIGASTRATAGRASLALSGMGSRAENLHGETRWAGTGVASVAAWFEPGARSRVELSADGQAISAGNTSGTASFLAFARGYREGGAGQWSWVGLGGGRAEDPSSSRHAAVLELGRVQAVGAMRASAGASLVDTRTGLVDVALPEEWVQETQPLTYVEPTAGLRYAWRRVELGADGGLRVVTRGAKPSLAAEPPRRLPWLLFSGGWQLHEHLALIGSAGRVLEDPVRGIPATRYASLSLRVMLRAPAPAAPRMRRRELRATQATLEQRDGSMVLCIRAAGTQVEAMGSVTGWEPVALTRRGDVWELPLRVGAGAHRLLVRVDGGAWAAPANLPTAADEFGGTVGLLTIP